MHEWLYAIQRMIDWIDEHACENPSLAKRGLCEDCRKSMGFLKQKTGME